MSVSQSRMTAARKAGLKRRANSNAFYRPVFLRVLELEALHPLATHAELADMMDDEGYKLRTGGPIKGHNFSRLLRRANDLRASGELETQTEIQAPTPQGQEANG